MGKAGEEPPLMGKAGGVCRDRSFECQAQECGPRSKGSGKPRQDLKQGREKPPGEAVIAALPCQECVLPTLTSATSHRGQ